MSGSTDRFGISQNVFRQCHAGVAGISQMMDICSCHLAHKSDLADGLRISSLLRGSDRSHGQHASAVGFFDQASYIFHGDTWNCTRSRE